MRASRTIYRQGNYGAHTLRKNFGYIQRTQHGVVFDVPTKRRNHSSPRIIKRCLGITDAEVNGLRLYNFYPAEVMITTSDLEKIPADPNFRSEG